MNDESTPQSLATLIDIPHDELTTILTHEREVNIKNPHRTIQSYLIDGDFYSTIRSLLIDLGCYGDAFNLEHFIQSDDCETNRLLDLTRVYDTIIHMTRDQVTELAIAYSLCPIHFIDWAICFDDDDPECDQIRLCFPHSHDT